VGLSGWDGEDLNATGIELGFDLLAVQRTDVRVRDDGVFVCWSELARYGSDLRKEPRGDPDGASAQADLARVPPRGGAYQVTSPAPVWTLATRASMKSRSERRLR
jgi:hypothetical protein